MNFDLRYVPFSRYGSYLACSLLARTPGDPPTLWLRQISGHGQKEAFRLEVLAEGQPVPFETVATPSLLELRSARGCAQGAVQLCIAADDLLRIRGLGVGLRLSAGDTDPFRCAIPWTGERWFVNLFRARRWISSASGCVIRPRPPSTPRRPSWPPTSTGPASSPRAGC